MLEGELHQVDRLVEVHEEARHAGVGHRHGLPRANLFDEQRNHAAARAHDVAVASAADGGAPGAVAGVGVDDGLHHGLGLAHGVDGVGGLVGRQAHDFLDTLGDGGVQHVVGADDVGLDGLHGEELAGGNLLEGSGMEDVVHAVHGIANRLGVSDVANEEANLGGELGGFLLQAMAHVILFLLVAGEDANFGKVGVHEVLEHGVAERACTARDHQGFTAEVTFVLHINYLSFPVDVAISSDSISSINLSLVKLARK